MLTKKSVDIFDTEKIKSGYFITYSVITKDWEEDEEGEDVPVYRESEPYNAIVSKVNEDEIHAINRNRGETTIVISDLFPDESTKHPKYKILGIKESAI